MDYIIEYAEETQRATQKIFLCDPLWYSPAKVLYYFIRYNDNYLERAVEIKGLC